MGWYKAPNLMHIFTETTTSDESWALSWERRRSQCVQSYNFPNTLLDDWEGLKKKRQSNDAHIEKIFRRATRGEITSHFFPPRFARCSMTSTLQICFLRLCGRPTLAVSPQNGTKSELRRSQKVWNQKIFLGGHVPQVSHTPSARFMRSVTCTLEPHFSKS